MHRLAAIWLLVGCTAACGYTVDEVKETEPRFTVTVPAPWDRVGTCIAAAYTGGYQTLYLPVPSDRKAQIIMKMIGPGIVQYQSIMFVFDIEGGDPTKVTFRRRPAHSSFDTEAREIIDRCGKT